MASALAVALAAIAVTGALGFLYPLATALGAANRFTAWVLAGLCLCGGVLVFRAVRRETAAAPGSGGRVARPVHTWVLGIAAAIAALLVLPPLWDSLAAAPHGDWDAWSIWNLRARYLAGGQWRHAVSPALVQSHPDYPLLLPGLVAHGWALAGSWTTAVPMLYAYGFFLLGVALLVAAVSLERRSAGGWLAALVLFTSAGYLAQVPAQYADVPLSVYLLATMVCLRFAERSVWFAALAGFFASCAAWTKNEGLAFALIVLMLFGRAAGRWLLVGAAPGLAIAGLYKLSLVPTAQLVRNTSLAGLADPARYAEILTAVGREAAQWGFGWKHPLLLLAVFALLLRFGPVPWRAWLVLAGQAGIYVGLYLVTQENLSWLISTSLTRLAAHLWPAAIFLALLSLRPLDPQRDSVVAEPIRIPGGPGKGSRRLRGRAANPAPED